MSNNYWQKSRVGIGFMIYCGICIVYTMWFFSQTKDITTSLITGLILFGLGWSVRYFYVKWRTKKLSITPQQKMYLAEQERKRTSIVSVQMLSANYESKGSVSSAVGRAFIGDMIAGGVGAVIGGITGKRDMKESTVRFLVEYENGDKKTEVVKVDSKRYNQLIQYL